MLALLNYHTPLIHVDSFDTITHLEIYKNNSWRFVPGTLRHAQQAVVATVYPKEYAHGFVVLCFVVVMQSFIMNSHEVFIHIHQGCFAGTGAIVRLPPCQWSKPDGYGKISQCITTTKHSKAKTVCIFLGIYCIWYPTAIIWRLSPRQFSLINSTNHLLHDWVLLKRHSLISSPLRETSLYKSMVSYFQTGSYMPGVSAAKRWRYERDIGQVTVVLFTVEKMG